MPWPPPETPTGPDMSQPPAPEPDDTALQPTPPVKHHVLPDYLRNHPDPRVRQHWARLYRRTAALKQQLAEEGALL